MNSPTFLHQLFPQTSGSLQRSQLASPTDATNRDFTVVSYYFSLEIGGESGGSLRRACVAAAACAVVGMADGGGAGAGMAALARDAVSSTSSRADGAVVAVDARGGRARWSDRRRCPPWRANSLESFVPENLPRPSAQRRFNSVTAAAERTVPALAPEAVAPFLARRAGMGCFSV
ncbi:hypothetical protein EJB05_35975, partial [Eragrostis curvula]